VSALWSGSRRETSTKINSSHCALGGREQFAQLLSREVDGVFIAEYEQGDIGGVLFRVAGNMDLEGIVLSKRLDANTGSR
jgi:hypothetical protein